jgi:hypothetical protein
MLGNCTSTVKVARMCDARSRLTPGVEKQSEVFSTAREQ